MRTVSPGVTARSAADNTSTALI